MDIVADCVEHITVGTGNAARRIAIGARPQKRDGAAPALLWLGGYRSDMSGTKAMEIDRYATQNGLACIRFDYSGHGASQGDFHAGTISRWLEETLAVLDHTRPERVVVIGSSMGGWIALRLIEALREAGRRPEVAGLLLIAPAPDFTMELIEPRLTEAQKATLEEKGYFEEPSHYSSQPNVFTRVLIEDGRKNRVLNGTIATGCPIHILQGMNDPDVPYRHALRLLDHLPADDVVLSLIRDGDHRLSRPQDLERMLSALADLVCHAQSERS